eukprot:1989763-Prorocentrum_lima.AAC.1
MPGAETRKILVTAQAHRNQEVVDALEAVITEAGGDGMVTWRHEVLQPGRQAQASGPGITDL